MSPDPPTSQTDGRITRNRNTELCTSASRDENWDFGHFLYGRNWLCFFRLINTKKYNF